MKCVRHNDEEIVAVCSKCGAGVCASCAALSQEAKDSYGTLCPSCYAKVLAETREGIAKKMRKKITRAVISVICYVIGWVLIVSAYSSANITNGILGFLLCGFYTGLTWAKAAQEAHDAAERKYGATYTVTSSGTVYKESGFLMKAMYFIAGVFFGIGVTPCRVIGDITRALRLKKQLVAFDAEINKVNNYK